MTPKEKAKYLLKKFEDESLHFEDTILDTAKTNSLICVDEILKIIRYRGTSIGKYSLKYWLEVKQEISLL